MADHPFAPRVREIVLRECEAAPDEVAVLLSGGVDSTVVLRGLLEVGKHPHAYSFTLDGHVSTDFSLARRTASAWGVPFTPILLPRAAERLLEDVRTLIERDGLRKKADIECAWPRLVAFERIEEGTVATGDGGDGHFGVSRRAMIECRDDVDKLDEYRRWYYGRPNPAQVETLASWGRAMVWPLRHPEMVELFMGEPWDAVNRPRQKQPFRDAFELPNLPPHQNLQLGDSGIARHFRTLIPLVAPEAKSPVAVYNRLAREA